MVQRPVFGYLLHSFAVSSLFLFTGENAHALREERRRWTAEFGQKHGSENLLTVDGASVPFQTLLDDVSVAPFIAAKRLVVVQGIPRTTKEDIERLAECIHPACVVLFCDGSPDRRLSGVKALLATATVKEFPRLRGKVLEQWMDREAQALGARFETGSRERLLQTAGEDQDTLAEEIRKLALGARSGAITRDLVMELAVPSGEQEVWQLTSLLSRFDSPGALRYAKTLHTQGNDAFSLWGILLWMLLSLVAVSCAAREGQRQPAKIASLTGVPFPTVRTLLPLAERANPERLRALLDWAVETDIALKTGGYRATGEAPQELLALVDECILRCGSIG